MALSVTGTLPAERCSHSLPLCIYQQRNQQRHRVGIPLQTTVSCRLLTFPACFHKAFDLTADSSRNLVTRRFDTPTSFRTTPPQTTCFRTDEGDPDIFTPHHPGASIPASSFIDSRCGPWANAMMERQSMQSLHERIKESAGGGGFGGGRGGGDDDDGKGGGGGGDGDGDGDEGSGESGYGQLDALPFLSLALAALHACYCLAIGVKEKALPPDFLRTAAGLSALLIASALRLNSTRYGFDSYVLGLGASVGVSVWSAERCFLRKEPSPSGVAAACSAVMAIVYTCALYRVV